MLVKNVKIIVWLAREQIPQEHVISVHKAILTINSLSHAFKRHQQEVL